MEVHRALATIRILSACRIIESQLILSRKPPTGGFFITPLSDNKTTMIIIPAIDLKDGKCVRLRQGKMDSSTIFNDDPVAQAKIWEHTGASRIHVVDLDGSVDGSPVNLPTIERIVSSVGVPVQLGGGIRNAETIQRYLSSGVSFVIVGTVAAKFPELAEGFLRDFPGKVAIGIDAVAGMVSVEGWTQSTSVGAVELARRFDQLKPASFIYTDIERDGMMKGPNFEATGEFAKALDTPVILSGGVTTIEDVRRATELSVHGVAGIIIGRALYEGAIDPVEAIRIAEGRDAG